MYRSSPELYLHVIDWTLSTRIMVINYINIPLTLGKKRTLLNENICRRFLHRTVGQHRQKRRIITTEYTRNHNKHSHNYRTRSFPLPMQKNNW